MENYGLHLANLVISMLEKQEPLVWSHKKIILIKEGSILSDGYLIQIFSIYQVVSYTKRDCSLKMLLTSSLNTTPHLSNRKTYPSLVMVKLWTCLLTPRERICISFVKLWLTCLKDSKSNKLSTFTICFLKMLETLLSSLQAFCKVSMSEETISLSSMETVSLSSSLLMEVLSLLSQVQASTLD